MHLLEPEMTEGYVGRRILGNDVEIAFISAWDREPEGRSLDAPMWPDISAGYDWFEGATTFFDVTRSRAWVLTRRLTHSAHHRGQLTTYLRLWGQALYSTYGPTADTGGLMQNHAPTIYAYASLDALLNGERLGGAKAPLPARRGEALTERPA